MYMVINRGGIMPKEYRTVKVHTEELQEILGTKSFVVEIEEEE